MQKWQTDIANVLGTLADRKLRRDIAATRADGFRSFLAVLEDIYRRRAPSRPALPA